MPRDLNDIIAASVGVNELSKNITSLSVYPNPGNSTVNFNIAANEEVKSISITDISGRVVFASNENITSVNVSSFANGIYYLAVSTNKQNYQAKVSVAK